MQGTPWKRMANTNELEKFLNRDERLKSDEKWQSQFDFSTDKIKVSSAVFKKRKQALVLKWKKND